MPNVLIIFRLTLLMASRKTSRKRLEMAMKERSIVVSENRRQFTVVVPIRSDADIIHVDMADYETGVKRCDYAIRVTPTRKQVFYYVELIAPQEIRLQRNTTENRLKNKPSKRDIETSNQRLLNDDANHRCVSREGEITFDNYLRIENSDKAPETVARMIKDAFGL